MTAEVSPLQAAARRHVHPAGSALLVHEIASAADGRYTARNLPTGSYQLQYFPSSSTGSRLAGWYSNATDQAHATIVSGTAPDTTTADIRLRPAATIGGTVTNGSGTPIAGVSVSAFVAGTGTIAWESTSAGDGSFSLPNLASATYDVDFGATSLYVSAWYRNASTEASATPVRATLPRATKIHMVLRT